MLTGDCKIEFPPPPSGAVNPDVPPPDLDTFRDFEQPGGEPMQVQLGFAQNSGQASAPASPSASGMLKAPPKPLCPPGMEFDYWYQSCWPETDGPARVRPEGTQWKHACLCPPDYSWLALERECWKRGQVPGSALVNLDVLTGYKPPPGTAGDFAGQVAYVHMPFQTYVFHASAGRVKSVFSDRPRLRDIDKIWRIGVYEPVYGYWRLEDRCHIQGIAHCEDMVVTSCMTKGYSQSPSDFAGYLQFMPYNGIHDFEDVYQDAPNGAQWNQRVLGQPWPHAVVGQAIRGMKVDSSDGVEQTQFDGEFLFPVGSEDSGEPVVDANKQSNIRIYDKHGNHYPMMETFVAAGYACGALFSYPRVNGDLYLLFLDLNTLSLLHYPWDGVALRFDAPNLLMENVGGYDSLLSPKYQAINFFYADDGLYLIGTHDNYMDTFRVDITVNNFGDHELIIDKIADCKLPATDAVGGIFDEGATIQPLENNKMRIWCAPYDYRAGRCASTTDERKCTHLWYFERRL